MQLLCFASKFETRVTKPISCWIKFRMAGCSESARRSRVTHCNEPSGRFTNSVLHSLHIAVGRADISSLRAPVQYLSRHTHVYVLLVHIHVVAMARHTKSKPVLKAVAMTGVGDALVRDAPKKETITTVKNQLAMSKKVNLDLQKYVHRMERDLASCKQQLRKMKDEVIKLRRQNQNESIVSISPESVAESDGKVDVVTNEKDDLNQNKANGCTNPDDSDFIDWDKLSGEEKEKYRQWCTLKDVWIPGSDGEPDIEMRDDFREWSAKPFGCHVPGCFMRFSEHGSLNAHLQKVHGMDIAQVEQKIAFQNEESLEETQSEPEPDYIIIISDGGNIENLPIAEVVPDPEPKPVLVVNDLKRNLRRKLLTANKSKCSNTKESKLKVSQNSQELQSQEVRVKKERPKYYEWSDTCPFVLDSRSDYEISAITNLEVYACRAVECYQKFCEKIHFKQHLLACHRFEEEAVTQYIDSLKDIPLKKKALGGKKNKTIKVKVLPDLVRRSLTRKTKAKVTLDSDIKVNAQELDGGKEFRREERDEESCLPNAKRQRPTGWSCSICSLMFNTQNQLDSHRKECEAHSMRSNVRPKRTRGPITRNR